ncbi:MAG: hypothetical protein WCF23_06955 [Candidatus Nitrosopolaris sp.]
MPPPPQPQPSSQSSGSPSILPPPPPLSSPTTVPPAQAGNNTGSENGTYNTGGSAGGLGPSRSATGTSAAGGQQFGGGSNIGGSTTPPSSNQGGFGSQAGGFGSGSTNGDQSASTGGGNNNNGGPAITGSTGGGSSSDGNQPVQTTPGSTGNLVTYIIPDLKIRMQAPANWQGPSSCVSTDSAGVISIPSTCNPVWIAENGNARVKINGETLLANMGWNLNKLSKAAKKLNDLLHYNIEVSKKLTINGVYPAYLFNTDRKNPIDGSTDYEYNIFVGTPNNVPWFNIVVSSTNGLAYVRTVLEVAIKVFPSVTLSDSSNTDNAQSLASNVGEQTQPGVGGSDNGGSNNNQQPGGANNQPQQQPTIPHF